MSDAVVKKSDLKVRTLSAVVMVAVAGLAVWLGGWVLIGLVSLIACGLIWEWWGLVGKAFAGNFARVAWMAFGVVYIGLACAALLVPTFSELLVGQRIPALVTLQFLPILAVIATDTGAYFTGRRFGGPKLAPRISPNKTWSGLAGGMAASGLVLTLAMMFLNHKWGSDSKSGVVGAALGWFLFGALAGLFAQGGDLLESWLKRRADVKDSGHLIPGHGGLLDRMDGMIALYFVLSLPMLVIWGLVLISGDFPFPAQS